MLYTVNALGIYLHLSQANQRRGQLYARDRMLVLAGEIAARMDFHELAAYCRSVILENNPRHIIRRWSSFSEAILDEDFETFAKQVWRRYPQEKAERLLSSFGLQMANERDAYYTDEEYAAAILGKTPDQLSD